MAVLARSSITLVTSVDIDSVYWFYLLQASTAAAPAKPTTVPATKGNAPSGWSNTEPTTVDINKTLYRVELTYFTDGTGVYSSVNQVSSYEAAKVAYNKASDVQTNLDNLEMGGANLWFNSQEQKADSTQWTGNLDEIVSTDLPNSSEATFKIRGTKETKYFVPYDSSKKYKCEAWVKATDSYKTNTGNAYPSILPYDMDKNLIGITNVFQKASSLTTLARDLNPGDTVVYATDLSGWETGDSYYNYVGIYNYTSSSGYKYERYTRNNPRFADKGSTKTNINKTNNTITLKAAYTGPAAPAGTQISQHTDGSTYIYPFGGFQYKSVADWTNKTRTFDSSLDVRLPHASYIRFYSNTSALWYFGLSLTDVTDAEAAKAAATAASNAQSTANTANNTANTAKSTADTAKATADAKKSMIKINAPAKSFTTANWKTYGAAGHSENWSTGSSYPNPDIKVGDTAYIVGTVTDGAKGSATVIGTVTAINGTNGTTNVVMTSQQLIFGGDSVDNVNTTATTAKNTADTANTNASTALSTANAAKTTAENAESRVRFKGAVKANNASGYGAITAGNIIVGTSAGYHHLKLGKQFDINYPILYCGTNIASGGTKDDNYTVYPVTITTTQNITLTPYKAVYIKGTLAGSLFTPASTTPLTQTEPTSASDTNYYMRLGLAYDSTHMYLEADHPIYRWSAGAFRLFGSSADEIVRAWCKDTTVTTIGGMEINGAHIATKSIEADRITVTDLSAFGATIGGFVIDSNSIHTSGSTSSSTAENAIWLCGYASGAEDGFTRTINGTSRGGLVFAIGGSFGVDYDGWIYAANATISGKITATSGEIGNWTIGARQSSAPSSSAETKGSLYTGTFGSAGGIYLIPRGTTTSKTIGGGTATDWRFTIGANFGVRNDGTLYANAAKINGSSTFNGAITATTVRTTANVGADYNGFAKNRWDHIVIMNMAGCGLSEIAMNNWNVGNGFKPNRNVFIPGVVNQDNSGVWKMCCVYINTSGTITVYVYNTYGGGVTTLNSSNWESNTSWDGSKIFANGAWITNDTTYPTIGS